MFICKCELGDSDVLIDMNEQDRVGCCFGAFIRDEGVRSFVWSS
jgi:hypothetical protein